MNTKRSYNESFQVPDNYFQEQKKDILQQETTRKKKLRLKTYIKPITVAASLLLVSFALWKLYLPNTPSEQEVRAYSIIEESYIRPEKIFAKNQLTPKFIFIQTPAKTTKKPNVNTTDSNQNTKKTQPVEEEVIVLKDKSDEIIYELFIDDSEFFEEDLYEEL